MGNITAASLGSDEFKRDYGLKYAYLAGAMYKGIASKELVVALGKAGLMGYLGTGGMDFDEIDSAIQYIKKSLCDGESYGMNLLCHLDHPELEEKTVDLFLRHGIRFVEAAAFMRLTPSIVRFRLNGLKCDAQGHPVPRNRVLAKISRPEVAKVFMQPPPKEIVADLLAAGRITREEAELSVGISVASEVCVEADSGGHTDQGVAYALMPAIFTLNAEMQAKYQYSKPIKVGAAGGIGTPHAAAASFIMGSDFVMTGSINQCTVEAGTSDAVKDILESLNVQDTTYAPAGDMFELGAKVQVARRGLFFPARANKLYELYQRYNSLDEIDAKTREQIESKYFKRSINDVWNETRAHYAKVSPEKIAEIENNPKKKMALIFKWYFVHSTRLALGGVSGQQVDYQIHCGPALGSFNQWVKGTELQSWRCRYVAQLAERIMSGASHIINERYAALAA